MNRTAQAFAEADKAWSEMLFKLFGKRSGTVRYQPEGQGRAGTELRRLYEARQSAYRDWAAARRVG